MSFLDNASSDTLVFPVARVCIKVEATVRISNVKIYIYIYFPFAVTNVQNTTSLL